MYLFKINEVKVYDDFIFSDNNWWLWILYYYNFIIGIGNVVFVEFIYIFIFFFFIVICVFCIFFVYFFVIIFWKLKNNILNKIRVVILFKWFIVIFLIYDSWD